MSSKEDAVNSLEIFVDGASRGNPGPSAVGVLLVNSEGSTVKEVSETIGQATNNIAEYLAFIFALQEALKLGAKSVQVSTDSQLLARQITGEYKVKEPHVKLMFLVAKKLVKSFESFKISHIPREQNKKADALANQALDDSL